MPMQSVFTYDELFSLDVDKLWDILTNRKPPYFSRCFRGGDSVNFKNCRENGSGTIEIRIGHATLDSVSLQAYINNFQNLFEFSHFLFTSYGEKIDIFNDILTTYNSFLPDYCHQTSEQYETKCENIYGPILKNKNNGNPVSGFFIHQEENTREEKIQKLLRLFILLTGSYDSVKYLIENCCNYYYHGNDEDNTHFLVLCKCI